MIYAMSDLHGCYEKYTMMLEKINFKDTDTLYILGDVVDRGDNGIKILLDVMNRPNVKVLMGNHDFTMLSLIRNEKILIDRMGKDEVINLYSLWFSEGGRPTYTAWRKLDAQTRSSVLTYISYMEYIAEITAGGRKYFLAHTVPEYKEGVSLLDRCADDFIFGEPDYEIEYLPDTYIVTGHTPTGLIDCHYKKRIWQKNHHIAIDCGAAFGYPLGCICLDTLEEFYVI